MQNKEKCGCSTEKTGCCADGKVHLHHLIHPVWDKLPENIQDMLHSLDTQKVAVLKELHKWARKNDQTELAEACEKKIEKINKRLEEEH